MNTRLLLGALATAAVLASPLMRSSTFGKVPEPGMVTFVTFSADGCQPPDGPPFRKLDQEYEGRAAIREINTSEYPVCRCLPHRGRAHPQVSSRTAKGSAGTRAMDESSMRQAVRGALKAAEAKPDRRRRQSSRQDPLLPLSVSPDGRLKDEDKGTVKGGAGCQIRAPSCIPPNVKTGALGMGARFDFRGSGRSEDRLDAPADGATGHEDRPGRR
ncbi:MAG: hypothetical protein ACLUNV_06710 [Sutterella wadsworthensis]